MKRGILFGVLLTVAITLAARRWWSRFSTPYGAGVPTMKGRAYWA